MEIQTRSCWRVRGVGLALLWGAVPLCVEAQNKDKSSAGGKPVALQRETQLGFEAIDAKNFSEALKHFNRVLSREPNNTDALYGRGWTYTQLHENQLAIQDYSKGIKLQPRDAELYIGRALARNGARDYNGLVADMEIAAKLDPENEGLLEDARSTRLFAWVKLCFFGLGGALLLVGIIPLVRVVRLIKAASTEKTNA